VAEETNTLEDVLVKAADTIERRSERQLDTLVRILEPAMLMLIGAVVFYVILAFLLPMFQLWDSL